MKKYKVYGIGNALLDYEVEVSDKDLSNTGLDKSTMTLVDLQAQNKILASIHGKSHKRAAGGSAANTISALAKLGSKVFYSCKVANDESGSFYIENLLSKNIDCNFLMQKPQDGVTGKCLVMISPDAERTMGTFLGISESLSVSEVQEPAILDSEFVYLEGYLVTSPTGKAAAIKVREIAEKNNVKTAITLSDPNMVEYFKDGLLEMIGNKVDLMFCNKSEALKFCRTDDLEFAQQELKKYAKNYVITLSSEGAIAFDGIKAHKVEAPKVQAVDANGAGDMFAGAFMHAISKGHDYAKAASFACYAASLIVSQYGAGINSENSIKLEQAVKDFKI